MLCIPSTTIDSSKNRVNLQEVRKKWYGGSPNQAFLLSQPISSTDTVESFCIFFVYQKYLLGEVAKK
jgi:hypothetical protein